MLISNIPASKDSLQDVTILYSIPLFVSDVNNIVSGEVNLYTKTVVEIYVRITFLCGHTLLILGQLLTSDTYAFRIVRVIISAQAKYPELFLLLA